MEPLKTKTSKTLAREGTARRSLNQKPLATEGTETTEPKIKSSKQKGLCDLCALCG
jgi:hypothetical protein